MKPFPRVIRGSFEGPKLCILSSLCRIVAKMLFPSPAWCSQSHPSLSHVSLRAELVSPTAEVPVLQSSSFFGFPMKKQSDNQK